MGVVRYAVECPGCQTNIRLRVAVAREREQPFFFVCPVCEAPTKAVQHWDGGGGTRLALNDGRLLDTDGNCAHTIHVNTEYPTVADASSLGAPGGSAFQHFMGMVGPDHIVAFQERSDRARIFYDKHSSLFARLTTYYRKRDWTRFDATLETVWDNEGPAPTEDWHREEALHQVYELMFLPLIALDAAPRYADMKTEWAQLWDPSHPNFGIATAFAKTQARTPTFAEVEVQVLDLLHRHLAAISPLSAGLLCNMLQPPHAQAVETLRMFRDDYVQLRDLNQNTFEACHKALRWVVGSANAIRYGNVDAFPLPAHIKQTKSQPPKNLNAFYKLVSADKRPWLYLLPAWDAAWDDLFDRAMRNDIGHASAHHNLVTGLIERAGKPPTPYIRFLQVTQRSVQGLLACACAMKYIRIYADR